MDSAYVFGSIHFDGAVLAAGIDEALATPPEARHGRRVSRHVDDNAT